MRCLWHEGEGSGSSGNFSHSFKKHNLLIYRIFLLLDYLLFLKIHPSLLFFHTPSLNISSSLHAKSCLVPQGGVHVSRHWTHLQCVTFAVLHLQLGKMFSFSIALKWFVYSCMNQIWRKTRSQQPWLLMTLSPTLVISAPRRFHLYWTTFNFEIGFPGFSAKGTVLMGFVCLDYNSRFRGVQAVQKNAQG